MISFSESRLNDLFGQFAGRRIAVVGDVMLDKYLWGSVKRISPEAPVPVVEVETETERLGGAANVANNIKALGGEPILFGVVGKDANGLLLTQILRDQQCSTIGLVVDDSRPTTVKTRVIAHNQHVVRIDNEEKRDIAYTMQEQILSVLRNNIEGIDGIIIEDYNKGVVVRSLIRMVVELAREHKKVVAVDPKFTNFFEYHNVTVFKPNKKEVEEVLGKKLVSEEDIVDVGAMLMKKLNAENVLLTRGEKGMTLFEKNNTVTHIPTHARHVADVSGAGDTVIAVLTMSLVGGATVKEAALLSNFAAGVVCGEVGIVPIDAVALKSAVLDHTA